MASDSKTINPVERGAKKKKSLPALTDKMNAGSNWFSSKNKGKKVPHIGVKH